MGQSFQPVSQQQLGQQAAVYNLLRRAKSGANNFYLIAALSVVNSFIYAFGGGVTFVIGLGMTQLVDGFSTGVANQLPNGAIVFKIIGLLISILIAGIFAIFGYFAGKGQRWAFITGMILYLLDALLLLAFTDIVGFLFHLYFLWALWSGLRAFNQLQKISAPQPVAATDFPQNIGTP